MTRELLSLALMCILLLVVTFASGAQPLPLVEVGRPGRVLMLRHALAPGTGDPPNFRLDDCTTQRNLDAVGRAQARSLGERLMQAGVGRARIYSSQWCRCLETARLLQLGEVNTLAALNSFYQSPDERDVQIAALRSFLERLPADGPPVVLVTHQVTIAAFTREATPALGGSLFQLNGTAIPQWIGTIESP